MIPCSVMLTLLVHSHSELFGVLYMFQHDVLEHVLLHVTDECVAQHGRCNTLLPEVPLRLEASLDECLVSNR